MFSRTSFHLKNKQTPINSLFRNLSKKFIGSGATYQQETDKVKIRGKFLKCRNPDMPTMLWFPEVLESAENWEKYFLKSENKVLDYRNVWLMNPRNFGDSDHHKSFDLEEVSHDIYRFIEENKLTYVTVGGHGYGAKIASAFGSYHMERTSGVICLEGGPLDNSYHEAWEEVKNIILKCSKLNLANTNSADIQRKIDLITEHPKWRQIVKQNLIDGKSALQWKFNMEGLVHNVKKQSNDISGWSTRYGIFPGRAFVLFADHSKWVFLNTNTIPFYKFFPKLEGRFPSNSFNTVQTTEDPLSNNFYKILM
jgi:pimeloyl-ACP methyl ester carboxylesterase